MAYRNEPLSENPASAGDFEVPLTAANGAPSGTGTVHATYSNPAGNQVNQRRRAPRKIQIIGRFSGTLPAAAEWVCRYWSYNPDHAQWVASEHFTLVGTGKTSTTLGQSKNLEHDPNARYGYLEVISGVLAETLEFMIVAQEW